MALNQDPASLMPMPNNMDGQRKVPGFSERLYQAAKIKSEISAIAFPYSDFESDNEIILAGYIVFMTNMYRKSPSRSYASC